MTHPLLLRFQVLVVNQLVHVGSVLQDTGWPNLLFGADAGLRWEIDADCTCRSFISATIGQLRLMTFGANGDRWKTSIGLSGYQARWSTIVLVSSVASSAIDGG